MRTSSSARNCFSERSQPSWPMYVCKTLWIDRIARENFTVISYGRSRVMNSTPVHLPALPCGLAASRITLSARNYDFRWKWDRHGSNFVHLYRIELARFRAVYLRFFLTTNRNSQRQESVRKLPQRFLLSRYLFVILKYPFSHLAEYDVSLI